MHVPLWSRHVGWWTRHHSSLVKRFHSKNYHHGHFAGTSPSSPLLRPTLTSPSTISGPQAIWCSSPRRSATSWPPSPSKPPPLCGTKVRRPTARGRSMLLIACDRCSQLRRRHRQLCHRMPVRIYFCHAYAPCTDALPCTSVNPWACVTLPSRPTQRADLT